MKYPFLSASMHPLAFFTAKATSIQKTIKQMSKQMNQKINIKPEYLSVLTAYLIQKSINRNIRINPQYCMYMGRTVGPFACRYLGEETATHLK